VEITNAVEKLFKVKVVDVHVMHILGKKEENGKDDRSKEFLEKSCSDF